MSNNYLKYLFKNYKALAITVSVIYVLTYLCGLFIENFDARGYVVGLSIISVVAYVFTFILVPIIYNYIHNKKAVDTYFALPLSKKKMLRTSLFFTYLVTLVPYFVLACVSIFVTNKYGRIYDFNSLWLFLIVMFLSIIIQIRLNLTLFVEANSIFDGIVMIVAYMVMPICIYFMIYSFLGTYVAGIEPDNLYSLIGCISLPVSLLDVQVGLMDIATSKVAYAQFGEGFIQLGICLIVYMIISCVGLKRNFVNRSVERAETISNDQFSYPFVIRFYTFSLLFIILESTYQDTDMATLILYVVVFICFLIANFVYRRKFSITLKDIIFFASAILIAFVFSYVAASTKGFKISDMYDKNPDYYEMVYYSNSRFASEDATELTSKIYGQYPDMYMYDYSIDGSIDSSKIERARAEIQVAEDIRLEAIDNFYQKKYYTYNYLAITTKHKKGNILESFKNDFLINDDCKYNNAPDLTYRQLSILSEYFKVSFNVYMNDGSIEAINFIDLK